MPTVVDRFAGAAGIVTAVLALGGCSSAAGSVNPLAGPAGLTGTAASSTAIRGSGPCPKAAIFTADASGNAIDIYPLRGKSQPMCGQITSGVSGAGGLAADAAGHLYVALTAASRVVELAGPYPPGHVVRTISDAGGYPSIAAVSPSGLVAIINLCSAPSCGNGDVAFYRKGATSPCAVVSSAIFARPYFGAFDAGDNLYLDAADSSGGTLVGEISGGCKATTVANLDVPGIAFPGGVAVDTKGNIAIADQVSSQLDVFAPGNFGKPKFTVSLQPGGDYATFVFEQSGMRIWTANAASASAEEFTYPGGGRQIDTVGSGVSASIAVMPAEVPGS
jgi:hypothetical protein